MSLSAGARNQLRVGIASVALADEIADAVDANTGLANGKIYVGDASGVAQEVTPSGDVTIDNTGVTTIGAAKVKTSMIDATSGYADQKATNAITAFAGGGQGSAVALVSNINRITVCATIGDSVKLPAATVGRVVEVINDGAAGADVFPVTGEVIDALAANTAVRIGTGVYGRALFWCAVAGTWHALTPRLLPAKYTTDATGTQTAPVGLLTGAAYVVAENTAAGAIALTTRTATQMFADMPNARVGDSYMLLIKNTGNNTVTLTAGGGVTITGTATIATNVTRLYVVTFTSATALVIQNVMSGTV